MSCQHIQEKLPEYLDKMLQPDENKRVEAHLTSCAQCRQEAALLQKSWAMLNEAPEIDPSPAYISNFYTKLTQKAPAPAFAQWFLRPVMLRIIPAFAAICLVIFVSYTAILKTSKPSDVQALAFYDNDEIEAIENFELAENYDFIEDFELIENFEFLDESIGTREAS